MKTDLTNQGYRVYEYLLALNPHEELRNKIMEIRRDFFKVYKTSSSPFGKPHIILANFKQYELFESRIVNQLTTIAMGTKPVKIELKDYGSFPAHTIFISITSKLPIQGLVKKVRADTQKLMKLNAANKPYFNSEPHITIARTLLPWQYEKGWLEYSHRQFTGRFIADYFILLKRPVGEIKYQIVGRFDFQNLPVSIKQGDLFS